jgi:hypothetical protein
MQQASYSTQNISFCKVEECFSIANINYLDICIRETHLISVPSITHTLNLYKVDLNIYKP